MKNSITLISLPYDSAHFNERMGAGPLNVIDNHLIEDLRAYRHDLYYEQIMLEEQFPTEVASTFQLLQ